MAKGHSDHHHQQQDHGTPTYIIMSVLFAIVIFALEGIKETITLNSGDNQTRATTLGFIGLGLSICFFWRRLHESLFKSMTALFYTASLWAYLVATIALPLLASGEDVASRLQLIHQCGLGGVVIAGFSLMAALLYHQKPVPALLMTTFAGFLVGFGSLYPLLRPGSVSVQHEFAIENRGAHGSKKVEVVEEEHKAEGGHHTAAVEHEDAHPAAHHEEEAEDDGHGHGKAKAKGHDDEHGSKKSKMKLAAKAAASDEEDEDKHEEKVRKAIHNDHEDEDEAEEEHAPRTLTAAQKAKLEKAKVQARAKASAHGKAAPKPKMALAAKPPIPHGTHWEYAGELGPVKWATLDPKFATCNGEEQSPINIQTDWPVRDAIKLDYKESTFSVVDNGHTVQVNVERGNFATIDGQRYELKQFHFHTPSEHVVEGKPYQMEVHFVHANDKGELAVIGAFINPGVKNPFYQTVWDYIPVNANEPVKPYNVTLNLDKMLPKGKGPNPPMTAFHYSGSLTTPPCSEKVNWNVLQLNLKFSQEQIDRFRSKYQMNARPTQPMNNRTQALK